MDIISVFCDNNQIGNEGCVKIIEAVSEIKNGKYISLDLSQNCVDEGTKIILNKMFDNICNNNFKDFTKYKIIWKKKKIFFKKKKKN